MPVDFTNTLVVGITASALLDLTEAARIFEVDGIRAYRAHMLEREGEPLGPGTGFAVVRALLSLNEYEPQGGAPRTEVVVMSRNSPEPGVRVMNSLVHHGLKISRFAFTGGESLATYATAFGLDLFLSNDEKDVQAVADAGACATAVLSSPPPGYTPSDKQVRIAFDADAVLFSEESEILFKKSGLKAFHAAEEASKHEPMSDGPFAVFLRKLARLKESLPDLLEYSPVRIAVVTARNAPAQTRVIATLRSWNVYVDAAFFLGGIDKGPVLDALRPHIFFDDQEVHVRSASSRVPAGRVPYKTDSPLHAEVSEEAAPPENGVPLNRSPADLVVPPLKKIPA